MAVHLWRQRELDESTFVDGFDFNSREPKPECWVELKSCESKQGVWLRLLSFIPGLQLGVTEPSV